MKVEGERGASAPRGDERAAPAILPRALLLFLAFVLGCYELSDYDILWHLRTGQLIPERGVPRTDWYSFASAEQPWVDVHWGFQLLAAAVYDRWGIPGLILMRASIATGALGIALLAYQRDWSGPIQVLVWLPALLLASSRFYERPEIVTLVLLASFLAILFHAERRPLLLWLLPVLQVVWANVQGLFLFGPMLVVMYLAEAVLRIDQNRGLFRHLVPVTVLCPAACLVSPYGIDNVLLAVELRRKLQPDVRTGEDLYQQNIAELLDFPTFLRDHGGLYNLYAILHLVLLAASVLSLVIAWRVIWFERRLFRVLLVVCFGWLSLLALRNANHFALVAGAVIAWNLASARRDPALDDGLASVRSSSRLGLWLSSGAVAACLVLVLGGRWHSWTDGHRRLALRMAPGRYSMEGIRKAGLPGMPERALVYHLGQAAAFIFANGPKQKVFMDPRLEVHSQPTFREYLRLKEEFERGGDWESALRAYRPAPIDLVVADGEYSHGVQAALFSSRAWEAVHYDSVLAVFVRRPIGQKAGIPPFDFSQLLFEDRGNPRSLPDRPEPSARPRWWIRAPAGYHRDASDDRAERAYRLAVAMVGQPTPAQPLDRQWFERTRRSILWYAGQAAHETIYRRPWSAETYRHLGANLHLLSQIEGAGDGGLSAERPWRTADDLVPACAAYALRQALRCDPNDYSANLYLGTLLAAVGAQGQALEHFGKLLELREINPVRTLMARVLPSEVSQLQQRVDQARHRLLAEFGNADPGRGFLILERYAHAGLLGEGLSLGGNWLANATTPQVDRVGSWHLMIGDPQAARRVFETAQGPLPPATLHLRLAMCDHVQGHYASAREHYRHAIEADPRLADAYYGLALLALLAGDGPALDKALAQMQLANLNERWRVALDRLAGLRPPK